MNKHIEELRAMLTEFEKDFEKFFERENMSAGTRVRKHMMTLRQKAQEIRQEVQNIKASRKENPPPPGA